MTRFALRRRSEDGIAMVGVLAIGVVLFALSTALVGRAMRDIRVSDEDRKWAQALDLAEAAVDWTYLQLDRSRDYTTTGRALVTGAAEPMLPPGLSGAEQRRWAVERAREVAASAVARGAEGDWVAIRPTNADVIFGVGFTPSRSSAMKTRVVRASYRLVWAQWPSLPQLGCWAILSLDSGPLANVTVDTTREVRGDVHSNATLTGAPRTFGPGCVDGAGTPDPADATASTACSAWTICVIAPPKTQPHLLPRDYYGSSTYDLCDDGRVHAGPRQAYSGQPVNTTGSPCRGPEIAVVANPWNYNAVTRTWTCCTSASAGDPFNGVFYAYRTSVRIDGSPGKSNSGVGGGNASCRTSATSTAVYNCGEQGWRATFITEAPEATCPRTTGEITMRGTPRISPFSAELPILALAGRDLDISGNTGGQLETLPGLHYALEQVLVNGSSRIEGGLVARNTCHSPASAVASSAVSGASTVRGAYGPAGVHQPPSVVVGIDRDTWSEGT